MSATSASPEVSIEDRYVSFREGKLSLDELIAALQRTYFSEGGIDRLEPVMDALYQVQSGADQRLLLDVLAQELGGIRAVASGAAHVARFHASTWVLSPKPMKVHNRSSRRITFSR